VSTQFTSKTANFLIHEPRGVVVRPVDRLRRASVALALFLVGCFGSNPQNGTVSGRITFEGNPVTGARINFYSAAQGQRGTALLEPTGSFKLPVPLPPGKYVVFLSPERQALSREKGERATPQLPSVPVRYLGETSDLSADVVAGPNDFHFELQP
jgi:hypothetical protein